jgi:tetratricopeptide (TPR) repeat protein
VTTGKRADLLLLDKNPLDDVHNLHAVAGVMVKGRWMSKQDCATDLAGVPARYRETTERLAKQLKDDPAAVDKYLADNDPFGEQAGEVIGAVVGKNGADDARNLLLAAQKRNPDSLLISEESINQMGYLFLGEKRSEVAVELFQLNTELYPKSGNTYDSLAETYLGLGNKDMARKYYQKALEVQPDYANAANAKQILASKLQ